MNVFYAYHGGQHHVSIVQLPAICGDRLVHLSQDGPSSWVLRDFVAKKKLRCSPPPNASQSTVPLQQIESQVVFSEQPPFHACDQAEDWGTYLSMRSLAVLGRVDTAPPKNTFGDWLDL